MGKGDSRRPQQPELARSEHNQTDSGHWAEREEAREVPGERGRGGPVPPQNRPGHRPDEEPDKPKGPPGGTGGEAEAGDDRSAAQEAEDPTVEADEADPAEPGPGDSEGARPA